MTYEPVITYEEAVQRIQSIGMLPLAPLFAEYPSLSSLTPKEHWHKDDERDPWLWRSRLAEEGIAAYGKFVKRKRFLYRVNTSLGSTDCFPTPEPPRSSMKQGCSPVKRSNSMR